MNDQDLLTVARDIMSKFPTADLATIDEKGYPHVRPMYTLAVDDDLTTYFATGKGMLKSKHMEANPKVSLSWNADAEDMAKWKNVQIKGDGVTTDDKALRHRVWNEMLLPYFPGGADDPNYVIVVVKPKELLFTEGESYPAKRVEF
jgi:general stress protein 26